MIKARNFITITIVIIIVFFLFASQGVARLTLSDKGTNRYTPQLSEGTDTAAVNARGKKNFWYIGADSRLLDEAQEYAAMRKSSFTYASSLSDVVSKTQGNSTIVLIDGNAFTEKDIPSLQSVLSGNSTVVFLTMPSLSLLEKSQELRDILGIQRIRGNIHLKGYQLFSGFMLGGEAYYVEKKGDTEKRDDLSSDITYFEVASSSRLYMIGQIDPEKQGIEDLDDDNTKGPLDSEDYPAVIWQHGLYDGRVFCINSDFMRSDIAQGILAGIEYETTDVMVSSFADARCMVTPGFPCLSDENSSVTEKLYGQNLFNFERNVIWPFIVSAASVNDDRITAMASDHIQTGKGDYSNMETYLSLLENERAEMGVMSDTASDVMSGLKNTFPDYRIHGFYGQGEKGVVVSDDASYLFTQDDDTLTLKKTVDADKMSFTDDLRLRSSVTAGGFYLTSLDIRKVIYPENEDDRYEKFSRKVTGNLRTYYGKYSYLTPLTISEAATRVSSMLGTDLSVRSGHDKKRVVIDVSGEKSSRLLMRTHSQMIVSVDGGSFEQAEDDCYIITPEKKKIIVTLRDDETPLYKE